MGGSKLEIKGIEETIALKLDYKKYEQQMQNAFTDFGIDGSRIAKDKVPVNEGLLKNSVYWKSNGRLNIELGASAEYAAFVEFGTRKYAAAYVSSLPADWQALAMRAKGGSGGTFDELVLKIYEWVRKKGIRPNPKVFEQGDDFSFGKLVKNKKKKKAKTIERQQQDLAYAIAVKIVREGTPAQPFLYPAFVEAKKTLLAKLQKIADGGVVFQKQTIQRRIFR